MKVIKSVATFFLLCFFIFKPTASTQVVIPNTTKEKENKEIKAKLDIKQDSIMVNLKKVVDQVQAKKPKVVYITRWREPKPDTVFVSGNPDHCDTVYFVVKKNNFIKQLFTRKKADTLNLQ